MASHHWVHELALGVESIDKEHERQVELVDALTDAIEGGRGAEAAHLVLDELVEFTSIHFMSEELQMRLHAYPGYQAHVAEHNELMSRVVRLRQRLEGSGDAALSDDDALGLAGEIRDWLVRHIDAMDRPLARYLEHRP